MALGFRLLAVQRSQKRYNVGEPSRFARFWACKAGTLRLLCA